MTKEQVLQVVKQYRTYLSLAGDEPKQANFDLPPTRGEVVRHMLTMCDQIEVFVEKDLEKAMRWLGFMQGCFWAMGSFTLNELREHNIRPVS